jgi:hypothetical protein
MDEAERLKFRLALYAAGSHRRWSQTPATPQRQGRGVTFSASLVASGS